MQKHYRYHLNVYVLVITAGYPERGGQYWDEPRLRGPFHSWGAARRAGGWPEDNATDEYNERLSNGMTRRTRIIALPVYVQMEPNEDYRDDN